MNCFVNYISKELIDFLEKELGIIEGNSPIQTCEVKTYIFCVKDKWYWTGFNPMGNYDLIDCGDNEELFKAVVAIRNDTDKNQWFASNYYNKDGEPDSWGFCTEDDYKEFFGDCPYIRNYDDYHKATVEELKKKFHK